MQYGFTVPYVFVVVQQPLPAWKHVRDVDGGKDWFIGKGGRETALKCRERSDGLGVVRV